MHITHSTVWIRICIYVNWFHLHIMFLKRYIIVFQWDVKTVSIQLIIRIEGLKIVRKMYLWLLLLNVKKWKLCIVLCMPVICRYLGSFFKIFILSNMYLTTFTDSYNDVFLNIIWTIMYCTSFVSVHVFMYYMHKYKYTNDRHICAYVLSCCQRLKPKRGPSFTTRVTPLRKTQNTPD